MNRFHTYDIRRTFEIIGFLRLCMRPARTIGGIIGNEA